MCSNGSNSFYQNILMVHFAKRKSNALYLKIKTRRECDCMLIRSNNRVQTKLRFMESRKILHYELTGFNLYSLKEENWMHVKYKLETIKPAVGWNHKYFLEAYMKWHLNIITKLHKFSNHQGALYTLSPFASGLLEYYYWEQWHVYNTIGGMQILL